MSVAQLAPRPQQQQQHSVRFDAQPRVVEYTLSTRERTLKRVGRAYAKVYTHPNNHAAYYPGEISWEAGRRS